MKTIGLFYFFRWHCSVGFRPRVVLKICRGLFERFDVSRTLINRWVNIPAFIFGNVFPIEIFLLLNALEYRPHLFRIDDIKDVSTVGLRRRVGPLEPHRYSLASCMCVAKLLLLYVSIVLGGFIFRRFVYGDFILIRFNRPLSRSVRQNRRDLVRFSTVDDRRNFLE